MNERAATRSDYAVRLERVVRWLADHLDDSLDLDHLAEVACLSPHHFHRVYHAMQGETAAETVRRLRLHRAAVELITGELPCRAWPGAPAMEARRHSRGLSRWHTAFHRHAIGLRSFPCRMPAQRRTRWRRH